MGRDSEKKTVTFTDGAGNEKSIEVETFPWEKLNRQDDIKRAFGI
jgi:hypothetical protein